MEMKDELTDHRGSITYLDSSRLLKMADMVRLVQNGSKAESVREESVRVISSRYPSGSLNIKYLAQAEPDKALDIAKTLFEYVQRTIRYVSDPIGELLQPADVTIRVKAGDCDCHAILLASMLESVGFKTILVVLPNHVYVELFLPALQKEIPLDASDKDVDFGELPEDFEAFYREKYGLEPDDYFRISIPPETGAETDMDFSTSQQKKVDNWKRLESTALRMESEANHNLERGETRVAGDMFKKASGTFLRAARSTRFKVRKRLIFNALFNDGLGRYYIALSDIQALTLKEKYTDNINKISKTSVKQLKIAKGFMGARTVLQECLDMIELFNGIERIKPGISSTIELCNGHFNCILGNFYATLWDGRSSRQLYSDAIANYRMAGELVSEINDRKTIAYVNALVDDISGRIEHIDKLTKKGSKEETKPASAKASAQPLNWKRYEREGLRDEGRVIGDLANNNIHDTIHYLDRATMSYLKGALATSYTARNRMILNGLYCFSLRQYYSSLSRARHLGTERKCLDLVSNMAYSNALFHHMGDRFQEIKSSMKMKNLIDATAIMIDSHRNYFLGDFYLRILDIESSKKSFDSAVSGYVNAKKKFGTDGYKSSIRDLLVWLHLAENTLKLIDKDLDSLLKGKIDNDSINRKIDRELKSLGIPETEEVEFEISDDDE